MRASAVIGVVVVVAACGGSRAEPALETAPQQASARSGCVAMDTTFRVSIPVYRECGVTREARILGRGAEVNFRPGTSGAMCYRAIVDFVVDEKGNPIAETARVIRTTDTQYANAVIDALRSLKYSPASLNGVPVAQVVRTEHGIQAIVVPAGAPRPRMPSRPQC